LEERFKESQAFIDQLLEQEDVARATRENIQGFTQESVDLVGQMMRQRDVPLSSSVTSRV